MMDSRALFARQVRSQCETLCELLACSAGNPVPDTVLERCKVSLRMLAGTMLVMEMVEWERMLRGLESLLATHGERRIPWDDRIAQLVFELIEKEELLASCYERDGEEGGRKSIPAHEVDALFTEVEVLTQEYEQTPVVTPPPVHVDIAGERMHSVATEFGAACDRVITAIASDAWQSRSADTAFVEELRRGLGTIEFYARVMDRIVASVEENVATPRCDLTPLETALGDFARELARGSGRTLTIRLRGDDVTLEPGLLPAAYWVLHAMIADVYERCGEPELTVDVDVYDRSGSLYWRVRDNGDTFLSDSRLDHEDQLAFYPGLRHVVRVLREHRGTLAVEPNGGAAARFEFTLPASTQAEALLVWEKGGKAFAARSVQVLELIPSQTDLRRDDAYGEYVTIESRRIPLLSLDALIPDAPVGNSHIAVIGVLEKRLALYVPGEGMARMGMVLGETMPGWKGMPHDVARVDGRRIALIDAGDTLRSYLTVTGLNVDVPEMAAEPEPNPVRMPAAETSAPVRRTNGDASAPEVLVIEQSESTRSALGEILARQHVRASFTGDVEEAIGIIASRSPAIIISEFRIPTMAAKRIVDRLRQEGKEIPVFVTTSQSGKTADLLVEKLGASGYLSKPLSATQVAEQLSSFLDVVR